MLLTCPIVRAFHHVCMHSLLSSKHMHICSNHIHLYHEGKLNICTKDPMDLQPAIRTKQQVWREVFRYFFRQRERERDRERERYKRELRQHGYALYRDIPRFLWLHLKIDNHYFQMQNCKFSLFVLKS